jgi:hypothetical protein
MIHIQSPTDTCDASDDTLHNPDVLDAADEADVTALDIGAVVGLLLGSSRALDGAAVVSP